MGNEFVRGVYIEFSGKIDGKNYGIGKAGNGNDISRNYRAGYGCKLYGIRAGHSGNKTTLNEKLLHRLDFNDGWLDFLNLPEFDKVRESDGDLLFKAAASGYELGYLDGWQDRDGLINKPWKG